MANPTFQDGAIKRRKRPGVALLPQDSATVVESYGIHNTTPPTLVDGDVAQQQLDDLGNVKVTLGDPAQALALSGGSPLPRYDSLSIDETDPADMVLTYKLGVDTVATKEIVVSGAITTITTTII